MALADGNIIIGTSVDMFGMNTGLRKISKSFDNLGKHISMMFGLGGLGITAAFVALGKSALDAASDLQEVQNVVDVSFTKLDEAGNIVSDMTWKIEKFSETCIEKFGMSRLAAKQTAGSFMAMGKSMDLTMEEASDMAVKLTGLTGDFASFYNISQEYARVALSAVYTGETETLKRYGIVLTEANLQQYALSQGIEGNVKKFDARSKAILRYMYIMQATKDMEGDFVRTQDTWANQTRVLHQVWNEFLITLGNGLISVLTPLVKVLNAIIQRLTIFIQKLWIILSNIFGFELQDLSEQASGVADNVGDMDDAVVDLGDDVTKTGKKIHKQLANFDELNNIITQSGSGSSSGGGGGISLPDIDLGLEDALNGFNPEDWELPDTLRELGAYIGNALCDMLDNIDWESIYERARAFGTGLADFLNGLFVDTDIFASVGRTIASALNTVIYSALAFAETFEWEGFGTKLADGVNEFFTTFDFASLANTIDAWVQGIYNAIVAFIEEVDWSTVWDGIKDFISNIDIETVAIVIDALTITSIGKILFGTLPAFIAKQLANAIATEWAAGGGLMGLAETFSLFAGGASASLPEAMGAVFGPVSALLTTIAAVAAGIGGLVLAVVNFFAMWENGFSWLKEAFMLLGIVIAGVAAVLLGVPAAIAAIVAGIVAAVATLAVIIKEHWEEIKSWFANVGEWINTNIVQPALEFLQPIIDWIKNTIQTIKDVLTTIGIIFKASLILLWNDFLNKFINPFVKKIQGIVNTVRVNWAILKAILKIIVNYVDEKFVTPIKELIGSIIDFGKKVINQAIGFIESFINGVIDVVNAFLSKLEALGEVASKITGDDYTGILEIGHVEIPRLAKGAVIPPNKEFMAILGDQKRGTNIEAPLDTIKQAFMEVLSQATLGNSGDIVVEIDGREVFRAVRKQSKIFSKSTGTPAFS